jgi:peroxiredoxin
VRPDDQGMTDSATMIGPGRVAPPFALPSGPDERVGLRDLRGSPVILAFYPADFSPVCSDQMALYEAVRSEFERYGAVLLGISVDGIWCHRAFAESRGIRFPLLSDFEPKGEVSRNYGVYADDGTSERALFVLDRDGRVNSSFLSDPDVNPGADGILTALEAMER